jgi:hypothetical protein
MSKRRKEGTRKSSTSKNADVKTKKNAPSLNMSKGNPEIPTPSSCLVFPCVSKRLVSYPICINHPKPWRRRKQTKRGKIQKKRRKQGLGVEPKSYTWL